MRFESLLAKAPTTIGPRGFYKSAQASGVESPDEQQMEQDFARLAYMFIQDRAAPLLNYMLGFEIVKRDEDGSRAVGIFGFKIGKDYYYVPAFFLNNQIKGVDMLFNKRTNMFVPLQEDWIDFVVQRQTVELGGPTGDATGKLSQDFERPNFDFLTSPPVGPVPGGKSASADRAVGAKKAADSKLEDAPWSLREAWRQMEGQLVSMIEKDAEFQAAWGGFVCAVTGDSLPFEKSAGSNVISQFVANHGGPRAVKALASALGDMKYASAALRFYPSVSVMVCDKFDKKFTEKKAAKIEVTSVTTSYMDGKERKRLVRDGFTIIDRREPGEKSDVYETDYEKRFGNPDESGIYDVVMRSGGTTRCWVMLPCNGLSQDALVVEQDGRNFFLASPNNVIVRDDPVKGKSAYDAAVDMADIELGETYAFVDDAGHATPALTVESAVAEDGERVRLRVRRASACGSCCNEIGGYVSDADFSTIHTRKKEDAFRYGPFDVELADHVGNMKLNDNGVVLPSNWKALKLVGRDSMPYSEREALGKVLDLGNMYDIQAAMDKNAFHKLAVESDGLEYNLRLDRNFATKPMGYKQAFVQLVSTFGLPVDSAEDMLSEAASSFKSRRTVKLAQALPGGPGVGVSMPMMPEQAASVDPYTGIPMYQTPYEQTMEGSMTGLPPAPGGNPDGENIGGESEMNADAKATAEQAASLGQKTVFEHSSIGGLAKTYDTGSVIDSYIPEFMKSLDKLGRVLFLYYWKNEDFAERYGSGGIAEMEDLLRGVFKSYGELVLALKKKAIDTDSVDTMGM